MNSTDETARNAVIPLNERTIIVRFPGRDQITIDGDASLTDLLLLREYLEKRIKRLSEEEFEDDRDAHR